MKERNSDLGFSDKLQIWLKQHAPGKSPFRLAKSQMKWWRGGPMSFFTQGMPNFKVPLFLLVCDAILVGLVYWLNQLCIAEVVVMDLFLLERINAVSLGLLVAGGMILGWILLYLQTGTFGKFLTQIEPAVIRDLLRKETFVTALRVKKRKRHYPRTRKKSRIDPVITAIAELEPEPMISGSETGFAKIKRSNPEETDAIDSLMGVYD